MRLIGLLVSILFATMAAEANADSSAARSEGTFTRPMWGDGHLWEFLGPKPVLNPGGNLVFGSPSNDAAHAPFYVIGSIGDPHAQLFFGPHDHVAPVPPRNGGTFNANWHIQLVTPTLDQDGNVAHPGKVTYETNLLDLDGDGSLEPLRLVTAADVDGDGDQEFLKYASRVQQAADMNLVTILPTQTVFICPVRDIEG